MRTTESLDLEQEPNVNIDMFQKSDNSFSLFC